MKLTQYFIIVIRIVKKILRQPKYFMLLKIFLTITDININKGDFNYKFMLWYLPEYKWNIDICLKPKKNDESPYFLIDRYNFNNKETIKELKKYTIDNNLVRANLSMIEDFILEADICDKIKDKLIYFINKQNRQF